MQHKRSPIIIVISIFIFFINMGILSALAFDNLNIFSSDIATAEEKPKEKDYKKFLKEETGYEGECEPPKSYDEMCYYEAKEAYHDFIDCLFAEKIRIIECTIEDPSTLAQPGDGGGGGNSSSKKGGANDCPQQSTEDHQKQMKEILDKTKIAELKDGKVVGFGITALEEYRRYYERIDKLQDDTFMARKCTGKGNVADTKATEKKQKALEENNMSTLYQVNKKDSEILFEMEKEKEYALKALDVSLRAFNEMRITYPLHKRYEFIIKHLQLYRNRFKRLRTLVDCIPSRFIKPRTDAD